MFHSADSSRNPIALCKTLIPQSYKATIKSVLYTHQLRAAKRSAPRASSCLPGVNLVGPIRGDFGLGQSCRLVAEALRHSSMPFSVYHYELGGAANETDSTWDDMLSSDLPYNVNLLHINPSDLWAACRRLEAASLWGHYNIGFWLWEQPEFPRFWTHCFEAVDEIWTPSEFVSTAIRARTQIPVYTIPYCIKAHADPACGRAFFGLPDEPFLFLTSFDSFSMTERKNPLGAIRAFRSAFPPGTSGVGLIIKATHASGQELNMLRSMLEGYNNIYILTDNFSKVQFNSLIACADAFVSLHRAEGFGLVMAEAMLLGTPVIATNWSANTEFMSSDTACLVDAKIVALPSTCFPYLKGTHWADPDEAQAAEYMRHLFGCPSFASEMAARAKASIAQTLSVDNSSARISSRLHQIQQMLQK